MKRLMTILCLAAVAAAAPLTLAGETAKAASTTYTGWITDEWCGAKNANADGKGCALDCFKKGSKLVLYVPETKKIVPLDDQKMASENVGIQVQVTGTMQGETLKVSKIEPVKT